MTEAAVADDDDDALNDVDDVNTKQPLSLIWLWLLHYQKGKKQQKAKAKL